MATWMIQERGENTKVKILEHKKFWRVPIFTTAAEYVVCSSYGNGHCPSYRIVSYYIPIIIIEVFIILVYTVTSRVGSHSLTVSNPSAVVQSLMSALYSMETVTYVSSLTCQFIRRNCQLSF